MAYTTTQRRQLKEEFAPVLARYRRLKRIILWSTVGLAASFLLPILLLVVSTLLGHTIDPGPLSSVGLFFPGIIVVLVLNFRMKALLKCPGCAEPLEKLGTYCPECGHAGLVPATSRWLSTTPAHCAACGRDMTFRSTGKDGRVRDYTIRACSSCGLLLDDEGV